MVSAEQKYNEARKELYRRWRILEAQMSKNPTYFNRFVVREQTPRTRRNLSKIKEIQKMRRLYRVAEVSKQKRYWPAVRRLEAKWHIPWGSGPIVYDYYVDKKKKEVILKKLPLPRNLIREISRLAEI